MAAPSWSSWFIVGVFLLLVAGFSDKHLVIGLNNGLALTPPSKSYLLNSRFEHEFVLIFATRFNTYNLSLLFCGKWAGWTGRDFAAILIAIKIRITALGES